MTPQKMGRKVGEKNLFSEKFLPHILFYDPFVSHSTTKKQRCGSPSQAQIHKKKIIF